MLLPGAEQGQAILYISGLADGDMNIWRQSLDPAIAPATITDWTEKSVFWFDISPDGKTLASARGDNLSDVVLISDNSNQK